MRRAQPDPNPIPNPNPNPDANPNPKQPDTIAYSVVVTTCAKADAWQRALEFFDEMQRKGLEPDVIARNSAISAW